MCWTIDNGLLSFAILNDSGPAIRFIRLSCLARALGKTQFQHEFRICAKMCYMCYSVYFKCCFVNVGGCYINYN